MSDSVALPIAEAACLRVLRAGIAPPTAIALRCGYSVNRIRWALETLSALRLVEQGPDGLWRVTAGGETATISVLEPDGTPARKPPRQAEPRGTAARLLALLATPRHRSDLPALLGVTRERVRQLAMAQAAAGRIRGAGGEDPIFALALTGDPTLLLTHAQERVLSAFPDEEATTLPRLSLVAHRTPAVMAEVAKSLRDVGLIEAAGRSGDSELWRLTQAGRGHWQRAAHAPRAAVPRSLYRSTRIANVLGLLNEKHEARTIEIARALDMPAQSTNALMQYLKRRGIVRPRSEVFQSPYELTDAGRDLLVVLRKRLEAG